jgi:hypothetical protein
MVLNIYGYTRSPAKTSRDRRIGCWSWGSLFTGEDGTFKQDQPLVAHAASNFRRGADDIQTNSASPRFPKCKSRE